MVAYEQSPRREDGFCELFILGGYIISFDRKATLIFY